MSILSAMRLAVGEPQSMHMFPNRCQRCARGSVAYGGLVDAGARRFLSGA